MAKDKNKNYKDLDMHERVGVMRQLADDQGMDTSQFTAGGQGRPGEFFGESKSMHELEQDLVNNLNNDYDYRHAIQTGLRSGDERFEGLESGVGSMSDAFKAYQGMKDIHKNDLNNGGQFSSGNDYAGVTDYLSKQYDKSFRSSFNAAKETDDSDDSDDKTRQSPSETVLSQEAQDILNFDQGARPNPFSKAAKDFDFEGKAYNPNTGKDSEEGGNFMDNYKLNVIQGTRMAGIPARGQNSLHNSTRLV